METDCLWSLCCNIKEHNKGLSETTKLTCVTVPHVHLLISFTLHWGGNIKRAVHICAANSYLVKASIRVKTCSEMVKPYFVSWRLLIQPLARYTGDLRWTSARFCVSCTLRGAPVESRQGATCQVVFTFRQDGGGGHGEPHGAEAEHVPHKRLPSL